MLMRLFVVADGQNWQAVGNVKIGLLLPRKLGIK
jgi:hypothetical protein